jgi:hypothetical protein
MNPSLGELAPRFLVRAITANFQRQRAADDERQQLAAHTPPVTDPIAQDYVAWRRAALWIAGVLLTVSVLLQLVEHQSVAAHWAAGAAKANGQVLSGADLEQQIAATTQQMGEDNVAVIDGLQDFLLFVKMSVAVLTVIAARWWLRVRRSLALARWAWVTALVVPLLVSGWPWANMLDFTHLDGAFGQAGTGAAIKQQFAIMLAAVLMATVAPKLIALFPGIMRASLTLKTLLPEAAVPGWLTVVFAPFLAGFLLLVLCFLSQVQGSWWLIIAILCLVVGPCIYVRRAADLVRPHSAGEVSDVVGRVRSSATLFNGIGIALLAWWLFDLDDVSWVAALHLLLDAAGGILLTMVVISDITLALLAFSQRQGAAFQSSELRTAYEQRLQSLATAGLTDVESALGIKDMAELRKQSSKFTGGDGR